MVRFWWIWPDLMNFFFVWVLFLCLSIEKWYNICLEAEKMWGIRRKCVFYIIFSNTTKHLKIFSFPENSISEKYLFSENILYKPNIAFIIKENNQCFFFFFFDGIRTVNANATKLEVFFNFNITIKIIQNKNQQNWEMGATIARHANQEKRLFRAFEKTGLVRL